MSGELSWEIRKLEARLEHFLEKEEKFVKELRSCLEKLMSYAMPLKDWK